MIADEKDKGQAAVDTQPIVRFSDHPKVQELAQRMADTEGRVNDFMQIAGPAAQAVREARGTYENMQQEFQARLEAQNRTLRELAEAQRQIASDLERFKWERSQLDREMRNLLDELLAAQQSQDLEQKWDQFLDDNDWLWVEKARPFQMSGIKFMASAKDKGLHGVLNADQMGLGKTLQATATLDLLQAEQRMMENILGAEQFAVLWLCPNSIKETSVREIRKWSPKRPVGKLAGPPGLREEMVKLAHANGMTLVCNYETLRNTPAVLWEDFAVDKHGNVVDANDSSKSPTPRHWPIIVLDEAHKFKNDGSQLFKFVETLCANAGVIFPMTGTPLMNRPEEFWAILHMLTLQGRLAGKFSRKERFINEYCNQYGYESEFRWGAADALMENVKDMVIRRRKDEVLKELPAKVGGITRFQKNPDENVHYVTLEGEQRKLYDMMRDRFYIWLDEQTKDALTAPVVIAQFTRLRQLALYPKGVKIVRETEAGEIEMMVDCEESAKFDECLNILEELDPTAEQCLIFTSYEDEVINALKTRILERFPDIEVGRITGKESAERKANVQDRFNDPSDKMRVVIGTTRAMGLGLNLQANCSNAIFLDLDWNPGWCEQAEDRLHRQGQENTVNIITIQGEQTIDGYIMQKLMKKLNMIEGVIERSELRQALDEGLI